MKSGDNNKIYLLFIQGKSIFSKFISWYQFGNPYTHVAIILDETDDNFLVFEAYHDVSLNTYNKKDMNYAVYEVEVDSRVFEKDIFKRLIDRYIRKKYSILGILGFLFRRNFEKKDRYFCSQLVYEFLSYCGVKTLNNTESWEVYPALLLKSFNLKKVIEVKNK